MRTGPRRFEIPLRVMCDSAVTSKVVGRRPVTFGATTVGGRRRAASSYVTSYGSPNRSGRGLDGAAGSTADYGGGAAAASDPPGRKQGATGEFTTFWHVKKGDEKAIRETLETLNRAPEQDRAAAGPVIWHPARSSVGAVRRRHPDAVRHQTSPATSNRQYLWMKIFMRLRSDRFRWVVRRACR
jgi:hypothetical protein